MMKKGITALFLMAIVYTRFAGIGWGLPYPLHPDERNMAVSVQSLRCDSGLNRECLNPHFFAYGQLPLYLGYFGIQTVRLFTGAVGDITFIEATITLRVISAISSIATVFVLLKLIEYLYSQTDRAQRNKSKKFTFAGISLPPALFVFSFLVLTFSPYFIQFSHFGTTESLLMLFYSLIVSLSLPVLQATSVTRRHTALLGLVCGLAGATKISSLVFFLIPVCAIVWCCRKKLLSLLYSLTVFAISALAALAVFSPHNIISLQEFISSLTYESSVGLGTYRAFYTRQFENTSPLLFPLGKIFPFALGLPQFMLFVAGFLIFPWKNRYLNLLRISIIAYLIPSSILYVKWTRFMAPVFPLMSVFAILLVHRLYELRPKIPLSYVLLLLAVLPGMAYLTVYQVPDVRFTASDWIYKNIPANSKILSETANVIDIPVLPPGQTYQTPNYQYASFDFYHLDENATLQQQLKQLVQSADYIIVPSRRVFANHPRSLYPVTARYYEDLFSGRLGYEEVAVFANEYIGLSDEQAEETWTVFDHPVIRIYRKVQNNVQNNIKTSLDRLKTYTVISYPLNGITYRLLVADTPEKREQGLMYVRSKKDAGGADGMVFTFEDKGVRHFWNKNTVTDLDIYWMNDETVAGSSPLPSIEKTGEVITVTSPDKVNKAIEIIK